MRCSPHARAIAISCCAVLGTAESKAADADIEALKAQFQAEFQRLERRIDTLEEENARLKKHETSRSAENVSPEVASLKKRVTDLESNVPSTIAKDASRRAVANSEAIKAIETKLAADATETRDIYRADGGFPFDVTKLYDLPSRLEFHGYMRSGFGLNGEGGKMEAFQAPGSGAKYRLGNEADTYGEIGLTHNWLREDNPLASPYVQTTVMMSYSTGENFSYELLNRTDRHNDFALRQAFVEAGNVIQSIPDIRFWVGQRYYQRHDIHINDFYYLDMSGYGGGVEDVPLGKFAKVSLAWIGGSVDDYATDNGNVAKSNFDLRISDMKALWGKFTLWFDYSTTKGGEVINIFNADGSKFDVQSSNGWAIGLIHRTEDDKLWGGYNEFSVQYGEGAAYNFASTLDVSGPDLDDASRFRVTDQFTVQPWKHLSGQLAVVYQDTKYGGPNSRERWLSLGARPIYHFNDRFSVALEGGVDWAKSDPLGTDGHLWKLTLAPQISLGGKFFSRPVLRAFVTYAKWSDDFRGFVGGPAYETATNGWSYGLQAEAWW